MVGWGLQAKTRLLINGMNVKPNGGLSSDPFFLVKALSSGVNTCRNLDHQQGLFPPLIAFTPYCSWLDMPPMLSLLRQTTSGQEEKGIPSIWIRRSKVINLHMPASKNMPCRFVRRKSILSIWIKGSKVINLHIPASKNMPCPHSSPWGHSICNSILQWMLQVQWPTHDQVLPADRELMLSFTYAANIIINIKRKMPTGTEYLQKLDDWQEVQAYNQGLGEQTNSFTNLVLQVRKLVANPIWPDKGRGFTKSFYLLGSKNQHFGFLQRPLFRIRRR